MGTGLWLRVGGAEPVAWARPAEDGAALLGLREGWNLAGWTGPDGTPAAEAFAGLGRALAAASRPAAPGETYAPGAADGGGGLRELRRGEALWVRLTADARWWQPGAGPHPVAFADGVAAERRAAIRGHADAARAAFAERWGVAAAFRGWAGGRAALAARYPGARGRPLPQGFCADYADGAVLADADCAGAEDWARAYFGALQDALSGGRAAEAPAWLASGTAAWAGAVAAPGAGRTAEQRLARERRLRAEALPDPVPALAGLGTAAAAGGGGAAAEDLAFLAADWLAGRAGERSAAAFFEALAEPGTTWEEAFAAAFGMTAEDFLAAFEPPAPRAAPDGGEPGIEACNRRADTTTVTHTWLNDRFITDPPGTGYPEEAAIIRRMVDGARATFARRWCVEAGFENRVGIVDSDFVLGSPPACAHYMTGVAVRVRRNCILGGTGFLHRDPESVYPHEYFHVLQHELSGGLTPGSSRPLDSRSVPDWLHEGTASYAGTIGSGAVSGDVGAALARELDRNLGILERMPAPPSLDDLHFSDGFFWGEVHYEAGFVAIHRLVGQSVEVAIVDVWRHLADPSATWRDAFARAFGTTYGDFRAAFDGYLAGRSAAYAKPDGTHWVRGVLHSNNGNPYKGARVSAVRLGGGVLDAVTTDRNGAFRLALPDGEYNVTQWRGSGYCYAPPPITVSGADVDLGTTQMTRGWPCS